MSFRPPPVHYQEIIEQLLAARTALEQRPPFMDSAKRHVEAALNILADQYVEQLADRAMKPAASG